MNEQAIRQVAQELWNDARLLLNATRVRQQRKWAATLRTAVGAPPKPPSATAQRAFCREACHRGLGWNEMEPKPGPQQSVRLSDGLGHTVFA